MVDSPTRPETKAADSVVDILMPGDSHKISENSQKLRETKKVVEDILVVLSTSQPVMGNKEISEEEQMESQPVMVIMVDKLTKAVNNLESKVSKEKSLKLPAINLMLRIQAALDECGSFPENSTVGILNIINMIPDKSAVAWKEKLEGATEIDSCETKTLAQSIIKESQTKDQERKQETKDIWIIQKCTKILQNALRTYEYASKTAAGAVNTEEIVNTIHDTKGVAWRKSLEGKEILDAEEYNKIVELCMESCLFQEGNLHLKLDKTVFGPETDKMKEKVMQKFASLFENVEKEHQVNLAVAKDLKDLANLIKEPEVFSRIAQAAKQVLVACYTPHTHS